MSHSHKKPHSASVTVAEFFETQHEALRMMLVAGKRGLHRRITEPTVHRPGLALAGFGLFVAWRRVQVFGSAECAFLRTLSPEERLARYRFLFDKHIPCLVFSRSINPDKELITLADERDVPIFKSKHITMHFISQATLALELMFAPRGTEIASMVDIIGVGVLIRGESGIGKSEAVLALIERGYSLVSDDATKVRLHEGEVIGTSSEMMRGYMEVRGIGIINAVQMFGVRALRREKRVDLVITLCKLDEATDLERVGIEEEVTHVLNMPIRHMRIPVSPGRDVARLIEVAAFQTVLRQSGSNPAKELNDQLIASMTSPNQNSTLQGKGSAQ